jgi:hypothetical protein
MFKRMFRRLFRLFTTFKPSSPRLNLSPWITSMNCLFSSIKVGKV